MGEKKGISEASEGDRRGIRKAGPGSSKKDCLGTVNCHLVEVNGDYAPTQKHGSRIQNHI
jgi:hypothetical protein